MIRMSISFQGKPYRKSTGLPPTKDNITLVEALLSQIRAQKALGTLSIEEYFPSKSNEAEKTLKTTRLGVLVREECERKYAIGAWCLSTYERRIKTLESHLDPAFGMLTITELTPTFVRDWLKKQTFSSAYASQVLGLMRFIFEAAVGDGLIERHPFKHIKPGDYLKTTTTYQRKQRINPLNFEEIERVIYHTPSREKAFWGVGFFTGVRIQELLALRWEDVDWENETIHIQRAVKRKANSEEYIAETKNSASDRIIEVDAEVIRYLKSHRKYTQLENGFIFKPERNHKGSTDRYSFNQLSRMWKTALKRADVSIINRSSKQIRHTYASLMLSEGQNPMTVATSMGHTSLAMLEKHYAKAIMLGKKKRRSLDITAIRQSNYE